MRLLDATPGEALIVDAIDRQDVLAARLIELGLTPGAPIVLMRRTPFSGPLVVRVRDYELSMRRDEAEGIVVRTAAPKSESSSVLSRASGAARA